MANRQQLIGREHQLEVMQQLLNREDAVLMSIYGRRRVGKTFLVKCFFAENFDFFFTGMYKTSTAVQLSVFHDTLQHYSGKDLQPF